MPRLAKPDSQVVFHADDFGMSDTVNQGVLAAFRDGLLTSTSILANAPFAEAACRAWPELVDEQRSGTLPSGEIRREMSDPALPFDLGIHLNLSQGCPLTANNYPEELLDRAGNLPGIGATFKRLKRATSGQLVAVKQEFAAQIEWMCDHGLRPTHLNGHQYVELIPQVTAMIPELLRRYSIPVVRVARESGLFRSVLLQGRVIDLGLGLAKRYYAGRFRQKMKQAGIVFPQRFFGTSHAGRIDLKTLETFLCTTPRVRLTEVGVHPGSSMNDHAQQAEDPWLDPLARLRPMELAWLRSAQLRDLLVNCKLRLGRLQSLGETSHR
jgi:predicted glycoside hydrolase/deacetylase ChbG (UPF0249 family)